MKKRLLSFALVLTMLGVLFSGFAFAANNSKSILFQLDNKSAWIDGTKIDLVEEPKLLNDRTMVPFRALAENIGCSVQWVDATSEIIVTQISNPTNKLKYKINDSAIYKNSPSGYLFFYRMDTTPVLSDAGNTLLPARYVSEFFGYNADWADTYSCVVIYPQATTAVDEFSFDEKKQMIKDIIAPVAKDATFDSFKIDEERFAINLANEINSLLALEGKRALVISDDLNKIANFRVYEANKFNYWEADSAAYGKDWEKLYKKVIGKYYAPNYEIHGFTSPNASTIAQTLKLDTDDWDELKDSKYSNIGIGLLKKAGNYTPIIIIAGN